MGHRFSQVRVLAVITALLIFTGCATSTPYQAVEKGSGYQDEKLETNRYRVSFAGNSLTSRETVENYLLYRAAEITLENGADYFIIADRDTESDTTYFRTFDDFGHFSGFGRFRSFHRFGFYKGGFRGSRFGFGISRSTVRSTVRYTSYADIVIYKGDKPENDPQAYNALDIRRQLASKVVIKEED